MSIKQYKKRYYTQADYRLYYQRLDLDFKDMTIENIEHLSVLMRLAGYRRLKDGTKLAPKELQLKRAWEHLKPQTKLSYETEKKQEYIEIKSYKRRLPNSNKYIWVKSYKRRKR